MKTLIQLEEIAKLVLAYWASLYLDYPWWVFWAWLLAPDLSMVGYLVNPKIGAWLYNLFHHPALAVAVGIVGTYLHNTELQLAGCILFGHSAMDRVLGYGLKHEDSFQNTHLGRIGK